MAGPPNEYRTLRTINTLLLRGAGFSIAAKTRKKTTRRKKTRKNKKLDKKGRRLPTKIVSSLTFLPEN